MVLYDHYLCLSTATAGRIAFYGLRAAVKKDIGGPELKVCGSGSCYKPRLELSNKGGRGLLVVLHEIAHYLTYAQWGYGYVAGHGPEFMGCLIDLLVEHAGLDRDQLIKSALSFEVPYYRQWHKDRAGEWVIETGYKRQSLRATKWRNPRGWAGLAYDHPELAHQLVGA